MTIKPPNPIIFIRCIQRQLSASLSTWHDHSRVADQAKASAATCCRASSAKPRQFTLETRLERARLFVPSVRVHASGAVARAPVIVVVVCVSVFVVVRRCINRKSARVSPTVNDDSLRCVRVWWLCVVCVCAVP